MKFICQAIWPFLCLIVLVSEFVKCFYDRYTQLPKSGFDAIPAGGYFGEFDLLDESAFFWTSTIDIEKGAYWRIIGQGSRVMRDYDIPSYSLSCRCLKNAISDIAKGLLYCDRTYHNWISL